MRSPRLVLAVTLLIAGGMAAGVAGCGAAAGAGVRANSDAGLGAGAVDPITWASQVCRSLTPWRARIASLNATAQTQMAAAATPQDTRAHMLALLDGGREATEGARNAVRAAGVPDVDGGAAIQQRFVAALDSVAVAYRHAYASISALPTTDADVFYAGVAAAMAALDEECRKSGIDAGSLASEQLLAGFDQAPGCR